MRKLQDRRLHEAGFLPVCRVFYGCFAVARGCPAVDCEARVVDGVVNVETFDVKAVFKRIPLSRKFVIIVGGVLLLGGTTGVAAIFIGTENLFGPSHASVNGLDCKTVQTVSIKKNGSFWVRKFIRTEGGDGPERLKTALRVAQAIHAKQHPDLVQVSVLDANGPELRSEMRGRAVAAQVVYIPDETKIPEGAEAHRYSAFYYDGLPNNDGLFYGLRIDLPVEDVEAISTTLTDMVDCADPAADAVAGGHDAPATGHGAATPESSGHGEAPSELEGGHGDAKEGDDHAPSPAAEGHAPAVDDEQLLTSTPEHDNVSMFSLAYIKSLIFGKGAITADAAEQTAPAAHADADEGAHAPAAETHAPAAHTAKPEKPSH